MIIKVAGTCGKPTKPLRPRDRFISEFFSKQPKTFADNTQRFQSANAAWNALDDSEKEVGLEGIYWTVFRKN